MNNLPSQHFLFLDFEETRLTPYLLCIINYGKGLTKQLVLDMEITFSPDRMKKIFRSVISNQDKLFRYLNALLSKDESIPLGDMLEPAEKSTDRGNNRKDQDLMPIYEKLLWAASRDKRKISVAQKTIDYLAGETDENGSPIISEDFSKFFATFKPFADEI